MSSVEKGKLGEQLTKEILTTKYPGAEILEQVDIKFATAPGMRADFTVADVVSKDGKILGIFESKVDGSKLSAGQKQLFEQGATGTLTGKNAGALAGQTVSSATVETNVFRWNSITGAFKLE